MPLFTTESLENLRKRIDLVDVLSSHIDVKRAGAAYKALCPFHDEKTPSFTIQKGDSHYHCFGCGAHGDAIQFLVEYSRMNFQDAVETLAHRFNVVLDVVEENQEQKGPNKGLLKDALMHASQLYHYLLLHTDEGHKAVKYLYQRGITLEFIETFGLGWAPDQPGIFHKAMRAKGFSEEILVAAGLIKDSGREFFQDRITFPICDATGSVIGFSARKIREETFGGKYINTSETPLFKKSRILYGLSECRRRIAKECQAIIVEGQLDALSLIFHGLNLAVAALGTAFGEGHVAELLSLGVKRIHLALDADKAGVEAAKKVGDLFQKRGVEVRVIRLPEGSDPDSFVRIHGIEEFSKLMDTAQDYLAFLVSQGDMSNPAAKTQLLQQLTEQIRQWDSPVMVHESLRRLAHLMQVPEEMVTSSQVSAGHYLIRKSANAGVLEIDPDRILESDLLIWLLVSGDKSFDYYICVRKNFSIEDLRDPTCRGLFQAIDTAACAGERWDLLTLAAQGDPKIQELLDVMMRRKVDKEHAEQLLVDTIQRILDRNWMLKCEEIGMKIRSGQFSDDEALQLMKDLATLKKSPPKAQR